MQKVQDRNRALSCTSLQEHLLGVCVNIFGFRSASDSRSASWNPPFCSGTASAKSLEYVPSHTKKKGTLCSSNCSFPLEPLSGVEWCFFHFFAIVRVLRPSAPMQNGASGQDEGATSPITPIVQAAATPPVRSATVHGVTRRCALGNHVRGPRFLAPPMVRSHFGLNGTVEHIPRERAKKGNLTCGNPLPPSVETYERTHHPLPFWFFRLHCVSQPPQAGQSSGVPFGIPHLPPPLGPPGIADVGGQ
mmetsp:Transcript_37105/g.111154  ORF Transcript_37105/g.111154 Transcript_37105/m.111154 type:complete len:247 (-) Transcript_37105:809-1549(-)